METKVMRLAGLASILCLLLVSGGCGERKVEERKEKVTDLLGRQVEVAIPAKRIVAIGPGTLRLVCYLQAASKVVGVEDAEKRWQPFEGRPYLLANPQLRDLPVIGSGGPASNPDPERLALVRPDVVFATYLLDRGQADQLQQKARVPVVVLSYGELSTFSAEVEESILLLGKLIGEEKRAAEVVGYMKRCFEDLSRRVKDIPVSAKPRIYVGGLGARGSHGIESTQAKFPPLVALRAKNVADESGREGSVMVDREKLLQWDPEVIVLDEVALPLILSDYKKNPDFYRRLRAVKEGRVYGQLPFNYYATNIENTLANAYWLGSLLYPRAFRDVDPVRKAEEIYSFLLGRPLYQDIARVYGGFKKVEFK
jgi:iron complex transport system substrate-binding protein